MSALHVVFKIGSAEYVLPAAEVLQMESYSGATPVPGTPPYVAGLVQIRGRVVPVVDLRKRLGLAPAEATMDTRILVGQAGDRTVGLLVDSGREVLKLSDEQFKPPPKLLADQAEGLVKAIVQAGSRLLMLLDFRKLIGEEPVHG
ncbi:chemotaxis protein CheW [Archangium sp.]|uniref:chemotaxis protein CheW n=1 Tax=Archangium sp. TaxID=1872627 RepID=UPI002D340741|nr:chemotaxis protein CheW [Archangium sp.]HYO53583.1 chemotaxis protein CheW [Archangium sp.]